MRRMPLTPFLLCTLALSGCYLSNTVGESDAGGRPDVFRPDTPGPDFGRSDMSTIPPDSGPDVPGIDVGLPPIDVGPDLDAGDDFGIDVGPICRPEECPDSPPPTCEGSTLRVFGEAFCDEDAMCGFATEEFLCSRGCEAGACTEPCGEWITDVVTGSGNSAGDTSVAIGSRGVYISYSEGLANEFRVALLQDGVWSLENVGRPNVAATVGALAIDSREGLHVIFSPPRSLGLRIAARPLGGAWTTTPIRDVRRRSLATIAMDGEDRLHVLHSDGADLGYVQVADGAFERRDLPAASYAGPNSLAVRGRITRVVFKVPGVFPAPAQLGFAESMAGSPWNRVMLGTARGTAAIAIHPRRNETHIINIENNTMIHRWIDDGMNAEEIEVGPAAKPDLVIDTSGGLHVSFHNTAGRSLTYGYQPPGGEWTFETVDMAGAGDDSSLGVARGGVHISHQSDAFVMNRELRYTRRRDCVDDD